MAQYTVTVVGPEGSDSDEFEPEEHQVSSFAEATLLLGVELENYPHDLAMAVMEAWLNQWGEFARKAKEVQVSKTDPDPVRPWTYTFRYDGR